MRWIFRWEAATTLHTLRPEHFSPWKLPQLQWVVFLCCFGRGKPAETCQIQTFWDAPTTYFGFSKTGMILPTCWGTEKMALHGRLKSLRDRKWACVVATVSDGRRLAQLAQAALRVEERNSCRKKTAPVPAFQRQGGRACYLPRCALVSALQRWRAQAATAMGAIPAELQDLWRNGCSGCRHRPNCTLSCWAKRGYYPDICDEFQECTVLSVGHSEQGPWPGVQGAWAITEVSVPQLLWKQPRCKRQHLKALLSALERLVCLCCCDAKPSIRRNPFFGCRTLWHLRCWPVRLQCVLRICQCWMQSYTTWKFKIDTYPTSIAVSGSHNRL